MSFKSSSFALTLTAGRAWKWRYLRGSKDVLPFTQLSEHAPRQETCDLGESGWLRVQGREYKWGENRKYLMGTWLKDTGTDFKRVPLAIFGLMWASERTVAVMSHRDPFLQESLRLKRWGEAPLDSCCGLNPKSPYRLCICTFAPARGILWGGHRNQDILPSWPTLGTKGREGRLYPAPSYDQDLCRVVWPQCQEPYRSEQAASTIMPHDHRQKSLELGAKQVLPLSYVPHLSRILSLNCWKENTS